MRFAARHRHTRSPRDCPPCSPTWWRCCAPAPSRNEWRDGDRVRRERQSPAVRWFINTPVTTRQSGFGTALFAGGVARALMPHASRSNAVPFAVVGQISDHVPPPGRSAARVVFLGRGRPLQPNVRQLRIVHADIVFELSQERIARQYRIRERLRLALGPTHALHLAPTGAAGG